MINSTSIRALLLVVDLNFDNAPRVSLHPQFSFYLYPLKGKTIFTDLLNSYFLQNLVCYQCIHKCLISVAVVYFAKRSKPNPLTLQAQRVVGAQIFYYMSISALIIGLSGDIKANPGPVCRGTLRSNHVLVCGLLNTRSLCNKLESLNQLVFLHNLDVFALKHGLVRKLMTVSCFLIYRTHVTAKQG